PLRAESLADEYTRLTHEQYTLLKAKLDRDTTPAEAVRLATVTARLTEIVAIPPTGYTLPKAAADLVAHAAEHGWTTLVQWAPAPGHEEEIREPFVTVRVGRRVTAADGYLGTGDRWEYRLTWHSRGCQPGRVRLSGSGLAVTPENPSEGSAPSVAAIRAVIAQHPGAAG
ncbi:hypothetical protein, partial [Streptomyces sp. NPDC005953]|uniref:hypothetical protein n=1 Tax=Streptomyces sp. NPDC005953 TaxID=3156719 RepID=UPI00340195BC